MEKYITFFVKKEESEYYAYNWEYGDSCSKPKTSLDTFNDGEKILIGYIIYE